MDSGGRTLGGVRLETIVYIGIAADIVLAVVVGVLIVWWRNKSKKRQEAKLQAARDAAADSRSDWATDGSVTPRQVTRTTGEERAHHRLDGERMGVSRSVQRDMRIKSSKHGRYQNGAMAWSLQSIPAGEVRTEFTEVEADFGFLDDNQSGKSQTSGRVVSGPPPHVVGGSENHVSFHEVITSEGQGDGGYTVLNNEKVVHNPLSASRKVVNTSQGEAADEHQVAKSVYYTYNDPTTLQSSRDEQPDADETVVPSSAYETRHEHVVRESVSYVETRQVVNTLEEETTGEQQAARSVYYRADVDETGAPSSTEYLHAYHTSSAYEMEDEETHGHDVVRESVVSVESIPPSPPPPPPPPQPLVDEELLTSTTSYHTTLDSHVNVVEKESNAVTVNDMSEWARMNFGYEEPEKRYIIQLEECTEVM